MLVQDLGKSHSLYIGCLPVTGGEVNPDPIWCYKQVSKWRRLGPSQQRQEMEFENGLDQALKRRNKAIKKKEADAEEKARKAARKAKTDARRIATRRAKRLRDREEAAAASGEDDRGVLDEEVGAWQYHLQCSRLHNLPF